MGNITRCGDCPEFGPHGRSAMYECPVHERLSAEALPCELGVRLAALESELAELRGRVEAAQPDQPRWRWWRSLCDAADTKTLSDLNLHRGWIMNSFDAGWDALRAALKGGG